MQRNDFYLVGVLLLIVILIFYPVFYTDYVFTDEVVQLWEYRPGSDFNMFISQGRWVTEILFARLFSAIDTIHEITYLRLFSLFGWLVCLPIWYVSLKRVMGNEPGYKFLPFFVCLYLVCSLPFSISIQWASTMELFIANTCGLLSGTIFYKGIRFTENKFRVSVPAVIASAFTGIVSLFTYQSGMGCFLIPFLYHYVSVYASQKDRIFITGLVFYFLLYGLYFVLFKLSLLLNHIPHNPRTSLHIDVFYKFAYFLARPLDRSFRFNMIFEENSKLASAIYIVLVLSGAVLAFVRFGKKKWLMAVKYLAVVFAVCLLSYLPSLVVQENYASNRSMLALDLCVFLACAEMALYFIRKKQVLTWIAGAVAVVLILSARYNFRRLFLQPVHKEYVATRNYFKQHYHKNIRTIYFIRPSEDAFTQKYQISKSMDEFGIPSSFMDWVPEDLSRQLVLELTGSRETANRLVVKHWLGMESFTQSGEKMNDSTLFVNMPEIIGSIQP